MAHAKFTDQQLRARLGAPRPVAPDAAGGHPPLEALIAHACDALGPDESLAITRHLLVCPDGSCAALFRAYVAGQAAAHDALYHAREAERSDGFIRRGERSDTVARARLSQSSRTFQCDDDLWATFTQLALAQGRTVDSLINEALAFYRSPRPSNRPAAVAAPTLARHTPVPPGEPRLTVVHEGVVYEVTKPRFVVGRQSPSSDLTIDDPSVSRQHALVERTANHYYLVDLGSTNGVECQGERILRKEIVDGDRFVIGDHEIVCVLH